VKFGDCFYIVKIKAYFLLCGLFIINASDTVKDRVLETFFGRLAVRWV